MMKCLVWFVGVFLSLSVYAMNTFGSQFGYHELVHIKLGDLFESSNPSSPNYVVGDGEWKKDYAEQQLATHRRSQNELKGFFEKLLPTITDPAEYYLIRKDMLSLICENPLENTATQISERGNAIIQYRNGYRRRLDEITSKEKCK